MAADSGGYDGKGASIAPVTALEAVRVLDLADESAVFATRILADLGADVIRVEHPDGGSVRNMEPFLDGKPGTERSLYHLYHNANKRSVTLDVTMADGADVLRRLAATADVIVETAAPAFSTRQVGQRAGRCWLSAASERVACQRSEGLSGRQSHQRPRALGQMFDRSAK